MTSTKRKETMSKHGLPAFKGGLYKSMDQFESSLNRRMSGPITSIEADKILTVRFLEEPSEWLGYDEHYTTEFRYFPCVEDGCPGCEEDHRPSSRSLAPALDVDSGRVIVVKIPKNLGEILLKRFKRNKTLLDRDYELSRDGEGMSVKYDLVPASPTKRELAKYKRPDLTEALFKSTSEEFRDYVGLELDDEPEPEPTPRRRRPAAASSRRKKTRRPVRRASRDDDDDYDDDEPPF